MAVNNPLEPIVQHVATTGEELTQPVIDHTEKLTRLEEQQKRYEENLVRQIADLEERLNNASASQAETLTRRIAELEAKLEVATTRAAETAAEEPPKALELAVPEIEESSADPAKERRGLLHRKRARRKGK